MVRPDRERLPVSESRDSRRGNKRRRTMSDSESEAVVTSSEQERQEIYKTFMFFKLKLTVSKTYFKAPNPFITAVIVVGLFILVHLMAFYPHLLPFMHLGQFGQFLHDIATEYEPYVQGFFILCMAVHTTEGLVGFYVSRFTYGFTWWTTAKWTLSSFINGLFSLKLLFNPEE